MDGERLAESLPEGAPPVAEQGQELTVVQRSDQRRQGAKEHGMTCGLPEGLLAMGG
jgi:hypothetical protein